jgi:hypothetical protein
MVDKIRLIALDPEVLALLSGNTVNGNFAISGNLSFSGFMRGGRVWSVNTIIFAANSHVGTISNTYYQKPANLAFIKVTATGSGGGSGAASTNAATNRCSSGGGGGATCESWFDNYQLSNSEQVIVMAGGRGGSNNQNGANGSNSIFGNNNLVIAGGGFGSANVLHGLGIGSLVGLMYPGGAGGIPYVGNKQISGGVGGPPPLGADGTMGGLGGSSLWGAATMNPDYSVSAGGTPNGWPLFLTQSNVWGVGGSGACISLTGATTATVNYGANGGPGVVIIEEYRWTGA